jgi:hypothetical protein
MDEHYCSSGIWHRFCLEDGGNGFLRNVCKYLASYTVSHCTVTSVFHGVMLETLCVRVTLCFVSTGNFRNAKTGLWDTKQNLLLSVCYDEGNIIERNILKGGGEYKRIVETYAKRESHGRSKRYFISGGDHFLDGSQTSPSRPSDRAVWKWRRYNSYKQGLEAGTARFWFSESNVDVQFGEIILVALTASELNFNEFKSRGLHEKHEVGAWNFRTISVFAWRQKKTTEKLCRGGRSHDLADAYWLLASSGANKRI